MRPTTTGLPTRRQPRDSQPTCPRDRVPFTLIGTFDKCEGGPLPAGFAPGDSVETCLVYLVPPQETLEAMQLRTSEDVDPITWPLV